MPTPAEDRPPTERDWHTDELPATAATRLPDPGRHAGSRRRPALRTLGADLGVELVAYKRRIGRYLLWRAGPAVRADARYMAIAADDLDRAVHVPARSPTARARARARTARCTRGSARGRRRCVTTPERPEQPVRGVRRRRRSTRAAGRTITRARLARVSRDASARRRVERALDVACGTGMSTIALAEFADVVVGARRLAGDDARSRRTARERHVRARRSAETLPFADGAFDAVTCSSGVHWFDQERFFAELARVVRPGGWVGAVRPLLHRRDAATSPEFPRVEPAALFARYPLPPRNPQVGDPRRQTPAGFELGRRRALRGPDRDDAATSSSTTSSRSATAWPPPNAVRRRCARSASLARSSRPRRCSARALDTVRRCSSSASVTVPTAASPCAVAQHAPQRLAARGARDRVDRSHARAAASAAAELVAAERAQLVERRRRAGLRGARRTRRRARPIRRRARRRRTRRATSGWCASTPSTSVGLTLTPPVMTRSFSRSTTRDAAVVVDRADVAGVEPAVGVEHGSRCGPDRGGSRASPSRRARGSRRRRREPHLGARDRDAVEREAAPRLREPVRVDDADAARPRRAPAARVGTARRRLITQRNSCSGAPASSSRRIVGRDERHDRRALGARRSRDAVEVEAVVHRARHAGDVRARPARRGSRRGAAGGTRASGRPGPRRGRRSSRGPSPPCPPRVSSTPFGRALGAARDDDRGGAGRRGHAAGDAAGRRRRDVGRAGAARAASRSRPPVNAGLTGRIAVAARPRHASARPPASGPVPRDAVAATHRSGFVGGGHARYPNRRSDHSQNLGLPRPTPPVSEAPWSP